jgi:hypothetical protein
VFIEPKSKKNGNNKLIPWSEVPPDKLINVKVSLEDVWWSGYIAPPFFKPIID